MRISTVAPSAMRNVVTMPLFLESFEKFWKLIHDPLPVTSTRFVVGIGFDSVEKLPVVTLPSIARRCPPSCTRTVV